MLILTGQRLGQITHLRTEYVDTDAKTISWPAGAMKGNRPHTIPYGAMAAEIIESRLGTGLVFAASGNQEKPFRSFSNAKRQLDEICKLPHWTLHDLRRSVTTLWAAVGVPPHVCERMLAHSQPLEDPLRRVPLLPGQAFILFEDMIDDRYERIELGPDRRALPPVSRWNRMPQHLRDRLAVNPEVARRRALAHPNDMVRPAYPAVQIHGIHLPAFSSFASGAKCGILLRDGQDIRPIPLSSLSPGFIG